MKLLNDETRRRKADHIDICLEEDVQARTVTTGFEDVHFVHRALPEINREEIDLKIKVFNHEFSAPIIVGAMTGGCLLYTSPSPRDLSTSRMPSSA